MKSKAIFFAFIGLLLASNAQAADLELINKPEQSQKLAANSWSQADAHDNKRLEQKESEEIPDDRKEKFYSPREHAWF
ncbi:hypothetical protein [Bdellovibrio bacteriovorus]|uniref:Secreted protein n=1 Tax=Bdellovibrio bacteriovorus str. Tiberius TaxID=1069642 RepID=K7ZG05_BDEBC|nr:hypothetical protein [Bdellovibrio bacteriovorus]AFY02032.1 hypothetical protein Bdt_2349 [Bdellovibrio bacteriovorus str. Tiberius]